jgi:hypothetical protein
LIFLIRRRPPPLGPARVKEEEEAGEAMSSVSDILLTSYEHSENRLFVVNLPLYCTSLIYFFNLTLRTLVFT